MGRVVETQDMERRPAAVAELVTTQNAGNSLEGFGRIQGVPELLTANMQNTGAVLDSGLLYGVKEQAMMYISSQNQANGLL